jgi:hypothetical protein
MEEIPSGHIKVLVSLLTVIFQETSDTGACNVVGNNIN